MVVGEPRCAEETVVLAAAPAVWRLARHRGGCCASDGFLRVGPSVPLVGPAVLRTRMRVRGAEQRCWRVRESAATRWDADPLTSAGGEVAAAAWSVLPEHGAVAWRRPGLARPRAADPLAPWGGSRRACWCPAARVVADRAELRGCAGAVVGATAVRRTGPGGGRGSPGGSRRMHATLCRAGPVVAARAEIGGSGPLRCLACRSSEVGPLRMASAATWLRCPRVPRGTPGGRARYATLRPEGRNSRRRSSAAPRWHVGASGCADRCARAAGGGVPRGTVERWQWRHRTGVDSHHGY